MLDIELEFFTENLVDKPVVLGARAHRRKRIVIRQIVVPGDVYQRVGFS